MMAARQGECGYALIGGGRCGRPAYDDDPINGGPVCREHHCTMFTIPQVASRWGVSEATVRKMAKSGGLRVVVLGEGAHRVPRAEVERWERPGGGLGLSVIQGGARKGATR